VVVKSVNRLSQNGFDPVMFLPEFGQTAAAHGCQKMPAATAARPRLMLAMMQERWL
jgi:hypothetical protein